MTSADGARTPSGHRLRHPAPDAAFPSLLALAAAPEPIGDADTPHLRRMLLYVAASFARSADEFDAVVGHSLFASSAAAWGALSRSVQAARRVSWEALFPRLLLLAPAAEDFLEAPVAHLLFLAYWQQSERRREALGALVSGPVASGRCQALPCRGSSCH